MAAVASAVAGDAPIYFDEVNISDQDLLRLIPVVLVLIALLLGLQLRSIVAPVYLVGSVLLSYLAMLGLAVLVFDVIGGGHGVNFILPGPRIHVPDGLRRGLQHSPDESREGGSPRSLTDRGRRRAPLERPAQRSLRQASSWQVRSSC